MEQLLSGMREELRDPRLIESYARKYNEERQRLAAAAIASRAGLESKRTRPRFDFDPRAAKRQSSDVRSAP